MFEGLVARVAQRTAKIAEARAGNAVQEMADSVPSGISVMATDGGIELSGAGLRYQWVLDPVLRDAVREGWS